LEIVVAENVEPYTIIQHYVPTIGRLIVLTLLCGLICIDQQLASSAEQQKSVDVLTYHYDDLRTGWNSEEKVLTPAVLKSGSFGLLFKSDIFDEQVDAQPLILSNFLIKGQRKNIVIVVTEYNTIYALDADSGLLIAARSIAPAVPATEVCGNGSDHLGINSTPVINEARDTLYLVAAEWSGNSFAYVLHAVAGQGRVFREPERWLNLRLSGKSRAAESGSAAVRRPRICRVQHILRPKRGCFARLVVSLGRPVAGAADTGIDRSPSALQGGKRAPGSDLDVRLWARRGQNRQYLCCDGQLEFAASQ
jgi:hypothetical protein